MESIDILGVRIDNVTCEEALARAESFLREGVCRQVVTVNPEFVVIAQKHAAFKQVLTVSELNVPDGVGLLWAARRLRRPLKERVAGQELVDRLAARAAECSWSIYLLGAREGVAARAGSELVRRHPGLVIGGCHAGSPAEEEEAETVERVNNSGAQIVLVAYGPPKQELWIARNRARLRAGLAMGVGGTFDTLAGRIPRAPRWLRDAGFEWAYRLAREPRRIRRQLAIPYFMWLVVTRGK